MPYISQNTQQKRGLFSSSSSSINAPPCVGPLPGGGQAKNGIITVHSIYLSLQKFLREEFECPLCHKLCDDTLLNPEDGNRFCGKCIKDHLAQCNSPGCQQCSVHIATYRACNKDTHFDRIVSDLGISIVFMNLLSDAPSHLRSFIIFSIQLKRLLHDFIVPIKVQLDTDERNKLNLQHQVKNLNQIVGVKRNFVHNAPNPWQFHKSACSINIAPAPNTRRLNVRPPPMDPNTRTFAASALIKLATDSDEDIMARKRLKLSPAMIADASLASAPRQQKNNPPARNAEIPIVGEPPALIGRPRNVVLEKKNTTVQNSSLSRAGIQSPPLPQAEEVLTPGTAAVKGGKKLTKTFDDRFKDLLRFKAEFGNCNVQRSKSGPDQPWHASLGVWCCHIRKSYRLLKEGKTLKKYKITKDDIARLDEVGFDWNPAGKCTFEERFHELMAFKQKNGHCNVPHTRSKEDKHFSLSHWCSRVRRAYRAIKDGKTPKAYRLSDAEFDRLDKAGFDWAYGKQVTFDERFEDLMKFKSEFGHCNVPQTKSRNTRHYSLGMWCCNIRQAYRAIQDGRTPTQYHLSKTEFDRLEKAGFDWSPRY